MLHWTRSSRRGRVLTRQARAPSKAPSRIGKTRAIEYVRLLLARNPSKDDELPCAVRTQAATRRGPVLFANLLEAVGDPEPNAGSNPAKRLRLSLRIREAAARSGSGTVLLFCDEAQRYNENEYEWLRDVHDALDRQQIKLLTFLVGQQELLAQKTALQVADPDRRETEGRTVVVRRYPQCFRRGDLSKWI
ncbi:ATP-binding protein [Cupriavidus necator]|uniref:ATP-binding protein n=1 Tax=Cupriavidus necator TaxID=106590 RepID=UPI0039C27934